MSLKDSPMYYHKVLERFNPKKDPVFENEEMQKRVWGRRWGVYNDVGTLKKIILHRPGDEITVMSEDYYDPEFDALINSEDQWYFRSSKNPDLCKMQKEHDNLARILKENGVEVEYLECSPRDPDAINVRDTAIIINGGAVVCRMGTVGKRPGTGRRGEEKYITKKLANMGMPILHTIHGDGLLEGGSFCFIDEKHAAVGLSYRQNRSGVDQLKQVLSYQGVELFEVSLVGNSLHLDGGLVMIDHDKALINIERLPYWFIDKLKELGIQLIQVDHRDIQKTVNCLALSPGRVLMCEGSDWTAAKLDKLKVTVLQIPYDECIKKGGGIHCGTLPVIREND